MGTTLIYEKDPERRERLRRERAEQGLPPTIEDPATLRRLARMIVAAADRKTNRR